jgi:hypothetical protein
MAESYDDDGVDFDDEIRFSQMDTVADGGGCLLPTRSSQQAAEGRPPPEAPSATDLPQPIDDLQLGGQMRFEGGYNWSPSPIRSTITRRTDKGPTSKRPVEILRPTRIQGQLRSHLPPLACD